LLTSKDDEWVFIPYSQKAKKKLLIKAIEQQCRNGDKMQGLKLHKIKSADHEKDLVEVEQKLITKAYKFGVLYCKAGQTNEDDMVSTKFLIMTDLYSLEIQILV
jgi:hypothetical protein